MLIVESHCFLVDTLYVGDTRFFIVRQQHHVWLLELFLLFSVDENQTLVRFQRQKVSYHCLGFIGTL